MSTIQTAATAIELKSVQEIECLRRSAQLAKSLLNALCQRTVAGMTTAELDRFAQSWMKERNCKPAFFNYRGYPANICVSVNEEVVHGIPGNRKIENGDIVGIDVGVFHSGWCGDTARTIPVGSITGEAKKLLKIAEQALAESIKQAKSGNRLGDISSAMQQIVEAAGYHVVKTYGGHGIGRALHEEPHIPCFGSPGTGLRLSPGMVLALEVMVNQGTEEILHKKDGWTVVTKDGSLSAHFEEMVAITESGTEVLTKVES